MPDPTLQALREAITQALADREAAPRGMPPHGDTSWACIRHQWLPEADTILALPEVAALRAQAAAAQRVRELAADLDDGSEWGTAEYPGYEIRTRILHALNPERTKT